jgi:3-oxoadipate enol-lactonase
VPGVVQTGAPNYNRVVAMLRVPGGELYYEAEGEGVPVVLVHGLALDARMWDDQVPALNDIARVVRYDARGFGRSTRDAGTSYSHADDLWRLVDRLEIDTAVLVGLSMGGRIVVEATLAAPERVQALVLLDAVLDGVPWDPDSERGFQAVGEALRAGGLEEAKSAWLRTDFFGPAQRAPELACRLAEMVSDYSGVNWTSADPHAPHPNSIELLETIDAPTTVVIAALDVPCFHEMSGVLADRIPGARKLTVPGVGHMVNMEAPEVVNALLREVVLRSLA